MMATVKKGILTLPQCWNVHFTKAMKRMFWKRHRKAEHRDLKARRRECDAPARLLME